MSNLKQALLDIQINQLTVINDFPESWQWYCDKNQNLFEKACLSKPEKDPISHLLGIATKQHIECLDRLSQQQDTVAALKSAFEENVGEQHSKKFVYHDQAQLILTTHIWIYLQGFLGLAFSLSNDYANQTAATLAGSSDQVQQLRTQFLTSYYLGLEFHKSTSPAKPFKWLKKLFGKE